MAQAWLTDFAIGGTVGGITKTLTAPIERVKLLIQTQDANPKIISGEVERYKGMGDCFRRVTAEQGFPAFWRGNGANVLRYFPQQAFNLSFKDTLKKIFPKYDAKTNFWGFFGVNLVEIPEIITLQINVMFYHCEGRGQKFLCHGTSFTLLLGARSAETI